MNLLRRHLDPLAWGRAFKKLLKLKGVKRGKGKNQKNQTATVAVCAAEVGVKTRTAERNLKLADDYDELPKAWQERVDSGKETVSKAKRQVKREENRKKAKRTPPPDPKKLVPAQTIVIDPPWWLDSGG